MSAAAGSGWTVEQAIWMLPEKRQFLRQRTVKVKKVGEKARQVTQDLVDTWDTVAAYGIAAPQIGSSLRMFIWKGQDMEQPEVIINPKIIRASGELKDYDGCLSVPGVYGETRRAEVVEITAWDVHGEPIRRTYQGFDARIIQHEIDHLEGVLFIDRIDQMDDLYVLVPGPEHEGEVTQVKEPLNDSMRAFIESERRPLPGYALLW